MQDPDFIQSLDLDTISAHVLARVNEVERGDLVKVRKCAICDALQGMNYHNRVERSAFDVIMERQCNVCCATTQA